MSVDRNVFSVFAGSAITPTAPLIEGAAAPGMVASGEGGGPGFDLGSSLAAGRYGCRVTFPAVLDLTRREFVSFLLASRIYGPAINIDTIANGGLRIIFIDSSGNYAGFNLYGGNVPGYSAANTGIMDGFFVAYSAMGGHWHISRSRQPDISSGSVNWASISAIEITSKTTGAARKDAYISRICNRGAPMALGSETFMSVAQACRSAPTAANDLILVATPPIYNSVAAQTIYSSRLGLSIGNGSAATTFIDSAFALGFETPHEFSPAFRTAGPYVQLGDSRARALTITQSASDVLNLSDGSIASARWWQWELSGSGVATCTRVQFWRFDGFKAAHGHYVDCAWNDADSAVEVTGATVISGGLIRGAKSTALKIIGAAGVYSGLELEIDGLAATYDIELGSGGAGTYELAKITVPDGYTLRLRNNSASNAVVVKLPLGLVYSTSTAGGAITVEIPEVSVDVLASALISGSRVQLYNVTDGIEMFNSVLPSSGLAHTVLYTGNKIVRLRADHESKLPLETAGVLTPSGLTFLDVQAEDDVYLGNGIDGGAVSEFAPDGANIQVDINDPDGVTNMQRLYAWLQWYMTTEEGVRSTFFGAVSAIDSANYVINQTKADIRLDNVAAFPVRVVGGYLSRRDGSTVIAPLSHSIQMDPGKAYAIETGVSGLTADEGNKLNQISLLALETTAQSAATAATAAAVQATEAADNTATLLGQSAPTAAAVAAAVWSDAKAGTLALEVTTQEALAAAELAASRGADLLAQPAPTVEAITDGVWSAVDALALEATADAAMQAAELAASRTAELLTRPVLTADAITEGVWAATADTHDAAGSMGAVINSVSDLALESTAQAAASNAALAAALSA